MTSADASAAAVRRELACSAGLLAVAALYFVAARNLGETALSDTVGPAGLPLAYAAVLAGLGVLLGVVTWLRQRLRAAVPKETRDDIGAAQRLRRAAGVLAIGAAYLVLAPLIGYPFAVALTIAVMAVYQGERISLGLALIACTGAGALFVLFDLVLGVSMPAPWNG